VLLLAVEITEAIDLVEHPPHRFCNRRFGNRAIRSSIPHGL
jgi:hypothetical protein